MQFRCDPRFSGKLRRLPPFRGRLINPSLRDPWKCGR